jgi:hypothetical protein
MAGQNNAASYKDISTYKPQPNNAGTMPAGNQYFGQTAQGTQTAPATAYSAPGTMRGAPAAQAAPMAVQQPAAQAAPMAGAMPAGQMQAGAQMVPQTVANPYFLAGYLQRNIGRTVRVDFMLGTNGALTDRSGQLMEVGASYIVLRDAFSGAEVVCDLFSIKFVTMF